MDIRKSIVAILAKETSAHTFAGTGFLVEGGIIITCAHVLNAAREDDGKIHIQFAGKEPITAEVIKESPKNEHDIVIIRPSSLPDGNLPLPLASAKNSNDDRFETYGFPELSINVQMLAAQGEILALVSDEKNFQVLQLHSEQVTKGYSGSPVWDKNLQAVVGIVNSGIVVKTGDAHHGTTFAKPADVLEDIYPSLEIQIRQPQKSEIQSVDNVTVDGDVQQSVIILGNGNTITLPSPVEMNQKPDFITQPLPLESELPTPGILPVGSRINFGHNPNFTGRELNLKELAKALLYEPQPGALTVTQTLAGMGGIGKTQLAIEFCYRYGRFFYGVHWMDARQTLDSEIAACGAKMSLPNWPLTTPDQVQTTLKFWKNHPLRLLVLDNLEEPQVLRKWKAEFEGLRVLVTSRNRNWPSDLAHTLPLDKLPRYDSITLLRKLSLRLKDASDSELDLLAERLGDLPLALDLAGCYLNARTMLTPTEYLKRLDEQGNLSHTSLAGWVKDASPTAHETSLAATFLLSWQQLGNQDVDEQAKMFFVASGYLAPNIPIPYDVLVSLAIPHHEWSEAKKVGIRIDSTRYLDMSPVMTHYRNAVRSISFDLARFSAIADDTILRLQQLGLLSETLVQHPLLVEFARVQATNNTTLSALADKMEILSRQALETGIPSNFAPLRTHLENLAPIVERAELEKAGGLWTNLGGYYNMIAEYSSARKAYEHALAIDTKRLGDEHPVIAALVSNLGNLLQDMDDLPGAKVMLERALAIDEKVYGREHPDIAIDINNLGELLHKMGDLPNAKNMLERALTINEKIYGKEHPNVTRIINNLGGVHQSMGDLPGAMNLYKRALTIDENTFGHDHPKIAIRLLNLATLLVEMGDLPQALNHAQRALLMFQKFLPPEHPNIEIARSWVDGIQHHLDQDRSSSNE